MFEICVPNPFQAGFLEPGKGLEGAAAISGMFVGTTHGVGAKSLKRLVLENSGTAACWPTMIPMVPGDPPRVQIQRQNHRLLVCLI